MLDVNETKAFRHMPICDGDLVSLDDTTRELYSVILVRDDRCWLRNLETGMDTLVNRGLCRRIGHEAMMV
jgi:hypothetical protein